MNTRGNPLVRSRSDRVIAGVCGGFAEWLGWNPTVVRLLYVVVSILSVAFPGILVYLLLWLVMPNAPTAAATAEPFPTDAR
jgi:phage shock protein C